MGLIPVRNEQRERTVQRLVSAEESSAKRIHSLDDEGLLCLHMGQGEEMMRIRTLDGDDDINAFAMKVMEVTVSHLESEGKLAREDGSMFLNTHICLLAPTDGPLKEWLKKRFVDASQTTGKIIIATVPL